LIHLICSPGIQSFIEEHHQDDPNELLLKYKSILDVPTSIIVDQIVGRRKAKEKLPTWYNHEQIIYPPSLNIEQSSSEKAALHKVVELKKSFSTDLQTKILLDLTGGFGVDSYFFSHSFKEIHFVEPNKELLEIVKHNYRNLQATNIYYYHTTAEEFLNSPNTKMFDLIYIDPSRRIKDNLKVFSLHQCEPDIVTLQDKIWKIGDKVLVKSSPLLDIDIALKELYYVKKISVLSLYNDCKELLFYCEKNFYSEPIIEAINLTDREESILFRISGERNAEVTYSDPLKFVYEPNASLLKSGAFKTIAATFHVHKMHTNTHLYTSDMFIENFPGRIFQTESLVKSDPKIIFNFFPAGKGNVITRNYPLTVEALRKKIKLKEGGDKFLIACSGAKKKFLIVASKIK
jgi:hypothetical protein